MKPRGERYPIEVRFWRRVVCLLNGSGCWHWTAYTQPEGYGVIRHAKKAMLAHRVSYELHHGVSLTPDQVICHSCDNPRCVNPAHLWLGSKGLNNLDRHAKGRSRGASHAGSVNPMSKLTEDEVRALRAADGTLAEIASRFGVTFQTVSNIRLRHTWKHVP